MRRTVIVFVALALSAPAFPTEGITMWGCAPGGERRNILYLADRGAQSYIKFSGQRITATHTVDASNQIWKFGANHIVLTSDLIAEYFERGELKARFKCRRME